MMKTARYHFVRKSSALTHTTPISATREKMGTNRLYTGTGQTKNGVQRVIDRLVTNYNKDKAQSKNASGVEETVTELQTLLTSIVELQQEGNEKKSKKSKEAERKAKLDEDGASICEAAIAE